MRKFSHNCSSSFLLTSFLFITFLLSGFVGFSQRTEIPDANFRRVLASYHNISADSDNTILNSDAVAVTFLSVSGSSIMDLSGIEAFTALTGLRCSSNRLTSLDVSANTALIELNCSNNNLISLNVKNGNNLNFTLTFSNNNDEVALSFNARSNPLLRCIQVDDASYSTREWPRKDETAGYSSDCTILSITTNPVSSVIPTSATLWGIVLSDGGSAVTERGFVYSSSNTNPEIGGTNVVPVTADGIGAGVFSKITTGLTLGTTYYYKAYAINNSSGTIYGDMQSFSTTTTVSTPIPDENFEQALIDLGIDTNGKNGNILTFDAIGIETLRIAETDIESFAGIEAFTSLTFLVCHRNQLTSLDVSANTALTYLNCGQNQLTSLNVSTNTALTYLDCYNNRLTSLDVSANTALTWLRCAINSLSELNVSGATALNRLECSQNELTTLDVSLNTALTDLDCRDNELTSLNVKNRNNRNFVYLGGNYEFRATDNPDLICILVDDAEWSTANWRIKDATSGYSEDCSSLSMITNPVSSITPTSATLVGNVLLDGGSTVTKRGFVYSSSNTNPEIGGTNVVPVTVDGTRAGVFTKTITSLTASTIYYYKSYATKNNITVYGSVRNFRTEAPATAPTVSTTSASTVTRISATLNGNITSDGRSPIIERGFVYSLSSTDLIIGGTNVLREIISGTETDVFFKGIISLTPNTTYYYKAYSTNGVGTGYGNLQNFKTSRTDATHIPDDKFRRVLQNTYNITADANGYILNSDAAAITSLDITYQSEINLTGIEYFTALTSLDCSNTSFLIGLDVSANTALESLDVSGTYLTSLDVSKNTALTSLKCGGNRLTELDISKNTALTYLKCNNNQLTELDVSKNTALTYLVCYYNQLTSLDVHTNTALTYLSCRNNQLTRLNVKNGNNENFRDPSASVNPIGNSFSATVNYNLRCIEVDDVDYSTREWTNKGRAIYSTNCSELLLATTNIPDANFRRVLSDTYNINADSDNNILNLDAVAITSLNVSRKEISNLSGIEAFTSLTSLSCTDNSLTTLDVSANTALTSLYCERNSSLTTLNVSGATALTILRCYSNSLSTLDVSTNIRLTQLLCANNSLDELNVSANTALTILNCGNNSLDVLNVSTNTALTSLFCFRNSLSTLDVSTNTRLTSLSCGNNSLGELNVSKNTALTRLDCTYSSLSTLDVSANTSLTSLFCNNNELSSLNVSVNTALTYLNCSNNDLTSLNVANGNNDNFTLTYGTNRIANSFKATGNADLTCIQVDDVDYSTANWTNKDATASYMTSCTTATTTQTLSLNTGWNLVGFNVEPTDNSVANIFAPVSSLVQIDTQTQGYNPSSPSFLNTLKRLENGQGYLIKLNIASQITLRGARVNLSEVSLSLSAGWNLISYPSENMADIQTALSNISQYIVEVNSQTQGYNSESPDFLNTLRQLEPGKGYWIKVTQNCNLTF